MRKPRDYDAELKALDDKAKELKTRKLRQLGELVIACRADELPIDELAGAMLTAVDTRDAATKEAWRKRGAAFFQSPARKSSSRAGRGARSDEANGGNAKSAAGDASAS
jgi:hypothetical protein